MTHNPPNYRETEIWTTIAVTPLAPGWRNVYLLDDGELAVNPCPALLLEECRQVYRSWDATKNGKTDRVGSYREADLPYYTHVAFGENQGDGLVEAACDTGNYLGTVGPDEDPAVLKPKAPPS